MRRNRGRSSWNSIRRRPNRHRAKRRIRRIVLLLGIAWRCLRITRLRRQTRLIVVGRTRRIIRCWCIRLCIKNIGRRSRRDRACQVVLRLIAFWRTGNRCLAAFQTVIQIRRFPFCVFARALKLYEQPKFKITWMLSSGSPNVDRISNKYPLV